MYADTMMAGLRMRTEIEQWAADVMRKWIDAVVASESWSLFGVGEVPLPATAGIPYGINLKAFGQPKSTAMSVSFGAYQYRPDERMVRVDLYRLEWGDGDAVEARRTIEADFGHLIEGGWKAPDLVRPVGGYVLHAWIVGKKFIDKA